MKPTIHFQDRKTRRDTVETVGASVLPKTDCSFQVSSFGDYSGRSAGGRRSSIRGISEDYFKTEARSHFASEATFFAVIALTVAVPIFEGIRGLMQFVY